MTISNDTHTHDIVVHVVSISKLEYRPLLKMIEIRYFFHIVDYNVDWCFYDIYILWSSATFVNFIKIVIVLKMKIAQS